jgi:hypothetical protein
MMADENVQFPLLPSHQVDPEAGEVSPLEGPSRHTTRSSSPNEEPNHHDDTSENEEVDGGSTA